MEQLREQLEQTFTHELAGQSYDVGDFQTPVNRILDRYEFEPWRHYHLLSHLGQMVGFLTRIKHDLKNPRVVFASVLGHDSEYHPELYDPKLPKGLNEELSAQYTKSEFGLLLPTQEIDLITSYIRKTADHKWDGVDTDLGYFLDADMLIFASPPDEFDEYDEGVTKEFCTYFDEELFRIGRKSFLQAYSTKTRIFNMPDVHERHHEQAISNINRRLEYYGD